MRKSKKSYFYHILVYPGDTHGAITLNVVWMEREFDAFKLSRCMCPSNYCRFWDTARYLWKKSSFDHTLLGGGRRNIGNPFGTKKLQWCRYPTAKKIRRYVYSLWCDPRTWQTDGQTDGRTDTAWQHDRACIDVIDVPFTTDRHISGITFVLSLGQPHPNDSSAALHPEHVTSSNSVSPISPPNARLQSKPTCSITLFHRSLFFPLSSASMDTLLGPDYLWLLTLASASCVWLSWLFVAQ